MTKWLMILAMLLLATAAHAAPVMVVRGTQYLDGWPIDEDGWSTFTPAEDTRIIYVSASDGDDANDGLSEATPKASIGAGVTLMRSGKPDWLLLKRGDAWPTTTLQTWTSGGQSKLAPVLFGAYGTGPRPVLYHILFASNAQYVVVRDLHFVASADTMDNEFLVENCWFGGLDMLIADERAMFRAKCTNIVVSRCLFDDHYYTGGSSKTGMYFEKSGLTLVDSFFFGNRDRVRRADEVEWGSVHALYSHSKANDVTIDNCVAWKFSMNGLYARGSASITDCLAYEVSNGAGSIGHLHLWETYNPSGVTGISARNINIKAPLLFLNSATDGLTVQDNISIGPSGLYGMDSGSESRGGTFTNNILYKAEFEVASGVGSNYRMSGNILWRDSDPAWARALKQSITGILWSDTVFFSSNDNPDFIYYMGTAYGDTASWEAASGATGSSYENPGFTDPDRGMKSYLEGLGYGPYSDEDDAWDGFLALVRAQDRDTYDEDLEAETINAYIRAGFEVAE